MKRLICWLFGHDEIWEQTDITHPELIAPLFTENVCWCDRCGAWLKVEIN